MTVDVTELMPAWSARDVGLATIDMIIGVGWIAAGWAKSLTDLTESMVVIDADEREYNILDFEGAITVTPEELNTFVDVWQAALVDMSTGHTHEVFTNAEHSTDDLLNPILTLPVEQMREFATALAVRLENDERVPFLVWSSYKRIVTPLIMQRPEGEILHLKTALATEVAELVQHQLPREDLVSAMAAALAWRGVEQLTKIKEVVVGGARPRLRGRQSCLFLIATDSEGKEVASVIV